MDFFAIPQYIIVSGVKDGIGLSILIFLLIIVYDYLKGGIGFLPIVGIISCSVGACLYMLPWLETFPPIISWPIILIGDIIMWCFIAKDRMYYVVQLRKLKKASFNDWVIVGLMFTLSFQFLIGAIIITS